MSVPLSPLGSHFNFNTELSRECLDWCSETEAFSPR